MNTRAEEFLVVDVGGQRFAFATAQVAAALAPGTVTPLPFVPEFIEGLVNANDRVLALINLARLFALPMTETTRSELVVLETGRVPCAIRVGQIVAKVDIDADAVEALSGQDDNLAARIAHGRFTFENDSVLILNPAALGRLVVNRQDEDGEPGLLGKAMSSQTEIAQQNTCLAFTVSGEHYALPLQQVVEILDLPSSTPIPGSGAEVEGLAQVREDVLLVLSLAQLLSLPRGQHARRQVLVLECDAQRYGLRVDAVRGTLSYSDSALRGMDAEDSCLSGVIMAQDQLVGLLSAEKLLCTSHRARWRGLVPARRTTGQAHVETFVDVLEIRLGDDRYGVPLELVRTISELTDFDDINPDETAVIAGAAHIKGKVLPVVDVARLITGHGVMQAHRARGAWLVLGMDDEEWAIPVSEARQIRAIPASAIESMDARKDRYVGAIATLDNQLLPLLSISPLLSAS